MAGVKKVESGYAGGKVENPSYEAVCSGSTGHAEVIKVWFDPKVASFTDVLRTFFKSHDPTTLNAQGADTGTQYRSAVFFNSDAQRDAAKELIKELTDAAAFSSPIVTEVTPGEPVDSKFLYYRAEDYHQDYYKRNPSQGYCRAVIRPKLSKLGLRF
jgi:methionine-S-sulfoxide reductase